jgi:hypothetical protein
MYINHFHVGTLDLISTHKHAYGQNCNTCSGRQITWFNRALWECDIVNCIPADGFSSHPFIRRVRSKMAMGVVSYSVEHMYTFPHAAQIGLYLCVVEILN